MSPSTSVLESRRSKGAVRSLLWRAGGTWTSWNRFGVNFPVWWRLHCCPDGHWSRGAGGSWKNSTTSLQEHGHLTKSDRVTQSVNDYQVQTNESTLGRTEYKFTYCNGSLERYTAAWSMKASKCVAVFESRVWVDFHFGKLFDSGDPATNAQFECNQRYENLHCCKIGFLSHGLGCWPTRVAGDFGHQ